MKNVKAYIAGTILIGLALIPPIKFAARAPSEYWPWWIVIAGFLGFFTLFIKTNFIIRFIAVAGFFNCFFSKAPYVSFTCYILLVASCYFYILCQRIKDYSPIFKMLRCLMLFIAFLLVLQCTGDDRLLNIWRNFSLDGNYCFGVVGQRMQSASFSVILAAALMPSNSLNSFFPFVTSMICNSAGAFLCAIAGMVTCLSQHLKKKHIIIFAGCLLVVFSIWMVKSGKLHANTYEHCGRLAVWKSALKMSWEHPFIGHGIGTFKGLFPVFGMDRAYSIPWDKAHNCWVQMIFELGYFITFVIHGYVLYLLINLARLTRRVSLRQKAFACIAGLIMIYINMHIHFPTRLAQTIFLIIFFLAYCQKFVDNPEVQYGRV